LYFVKKNYFHHVSGGAEEAQYIIEKVDNIHITGSARTHDLIVWGTDDPAKKVIPQLEFHLIHALTITIFFVLNCRKDNPN
jgi:hypothetical protein